MAVKLTRRRQLRVRQDHDEALQAIARQRGCDVSDLYREAAIAYFSLPVDATDNDRVSKEVAGEKAS